MKTHKQELHSLRIFNEILQTNFSALRHEVLTLKREIDELKRQVQRNEARSKANKK